MERYGWLVSHWGGSENNRRARFYRLTAAGRRQHKKEAAQCTRVSLAIAFALNAT